MSSAYEPTVKIVDAVNSRKGKKNQAVHLTDGKIQNSTFKMRNGESVQPTFFEYRQKANTTQITIVIQRCVNKMEERVGTKLRVTVEKEGRTIKVIAPRLSPASSPSSETVNVKNATPGLYVIRVSVVPITHDNRRASLKKASVGVLEAVTELNLTSQSTITSEQFLIVVATSFAQNPYPLLPLNAAIEAISNMTSCDSITVTWVATVGRHCLHIREAPSSDNPASIEKFPKEQCIHGMIGGLVRCQSVASVPSAEGVKMVEMVSGLRSGTYYYVDVLVLKIDGGKDSLSYRQLTMRTSDSC